MNKLIGTAALGLVFLGFVLGYTLAPTVPLPQATTAADRPLAHGQRDTAASTPAPPLLLSLPSLRALPPAQQPATPPGEQALCNQLRQLAATDPQRALTLAVSAANPRQRELFRNAALQGWATRHAKDAAIWSLSNVRPEERHAAVAAIAAGAIAQPEQAVDAFNFLVSADSSQASDHGNALVAAFTQAGQFDLASGFASSGPAEFRAAWLCTVYNQWAAYQPHDALASLNQLPDSPAREQARAGLFAGWSTSDPAALVTYAQTLPTGDARLQALNEGLAQWVHRDPGAASAWMDKFDPAPDLDAGAAAVAIAPALVAQKPDVAASWAESITDPELRANTLLDLIRLWAEHDPASARQYATTSPALRPDTRELALASLQPSP